MSSRPTAPGLLVAALVAALMGLAAPGLAQTPDLSVDDIVEALVDEGFYLEGASPSEEQAVAALLADRPDLYVVEVDEDVPPLALADDIAARLGGGTIVVLTPFEIGWSSDSYSDAVIESAIDASLVEWDRSAAAGIEAFTAALDAAGEPAASGGGLGWLLPVGLIALVGGGFLLMSRRAKRRREDRLQERLEEARSELDGQLAVVSNYIVDLADRVGVSDDEQAEGLFRAAAVTFEAVQNTLPQAASFDDFERLSDQLDEARWQLESAEAHLEGREPPPPPPPDRPARCFFDPNHRAGTEEAVLETAAGSRTVSVCRQCKARLERGERITPRDISVGGRPVPAPQAPKSHGGLGFDWLDVFQILVGGASVGYDMRGGSRRPSRTRRSTIPSLPSTRRSSTRSSRSTRTARPTRGRGTRTRGSRSRASRSRGSRSRGSRTRRR